jgi:hypothetical protein
LNFCGEIQKIAATMGDKNSDQSIMDKSMRSVFGELTQKTKKLLKIYFQNFCKPQENFLNFNLISSR